MCRPDNMPTLCKAIEERVAKFIAEKKKFSAWDVTTAIRGEVNRRVLDVDDSETGKVYVAGASVAKIDHEIVKECVHDIFHSGEMAGYDREFNGTYFEYVEKTADPVDDSSDTTPDDSGSDGDDYDGSSLLSN